MLKQQDYTGRVLPYNVANTPCADLGVDGMLDKVNARDCNPDRPLYKACEYFIDQKCDFGTAYAQLRRHLHDFNPDEHVVEAELKDKGMRQNLLSNKKITNGDAPPRRVWDLHANRIVPWWVANKYPWAISHAWVDGTDLKGEMTPINGYEWPVPMPKGADLNLIRIEMLRLGAEYIWLDILCLRQEGQGEDARGNAVQEEWERREALRQEEWKVDLPTIGWIYYRAGQVVCYFSGLGLPLSLQPGDFESDRCWFNRAWTLQEITEIPIMAGRTRDDYGGWFTMKRKLSNWFSQSWRPQQIRRDDPPMAVETYVDDRFITEDMRKLLDEKLRSLQKMRGNDSMFHILSQMQKRKSTKAVDKIAGLVYLFYSQYIPIYDADQSEEDAWTELINGMQDWFRADFFFLYPEPGDGNKFWRPSWRQVMTETLPVLTAPFHSYTEQTCDKVPVCRTESKGDWCYGSRFNSCRVRGLSDESTPEIARSGTLDTNDRLGDKHPC